MVDERIDGHDANRIGVPPAAGLQAAGCLTVVEAASWLGISRAKLYELLAAGEVRSFTVGRARRIPMAELVRFVEQRLEADATG